MKQDTSGCAIIAAAAKVSAGPRPGDLLKFWINDMQAQRRGPQRSEDTRRPAKRSEAA